MELNDLEKKIYEYITQTIRQDGYSPSVRDIQNALSIKSTSTVHSYLAKLEQKGYIQKESGKSRTLRIENNAFDARKTIKVPILGKVTAGTPITAIENCEGYLDFPALNRSYNSTNLFALRVEGVSMINAGILDGDIAVIKKESYADNGEIVVAMIDDEATIKRFYKENGHFRLQPENDTMEPIISKEVYILGKVVSVIRFY